MSNVAYVVAAEGESWKLMHQGRPAGEFPAEQQALDTTIDLAKEAYAVGHDAVVVVKDEDGVREAWRQEHAAGD